jgi:hypothetical protein
LIGSQTADGADFLAGGAEPGQQGAIGPVAVAVQCRVRIGIRQDADVRQPGPAILCEAPDLVLAERDAVDPEFRQGAQEPLLIGIRA